jgi:hypothetical protein
MNSPPDNCGSGTMNIPHTNGILGPNMCIPQPQTWGFHTQSFINQGVMAILQQRRLGHHFRVGLEPRTSGFSTLCYSVYKLPDVWAEPVSPNCRPRMFALIRQFQALSDTKIPFYASSNQFQVVFHFIRILLSWPAFSDSLIFEAVASCRLATTQSVILCNSGFKDKQCKPISFLCRF